VTLAVLQFVLGVASIVVLTVFVIRHGERADETGFVALGLTAANFALLVVRYGILRRRPERPKPN
jgi:hypothetical protein